MVDSRQEVELPAWAHFVLGLGIGSLLGFLGLALCVLAASF